MKHGDRFLRLAEEARERVKEISPDEAAQLVREGALLIDVREESEWRSGHAEGAIHLSKGMLEVEIEDEAPDPEQTVICYCGGGNRAALAADNLQKMGYKNVRSIQGGLRSWKAADLPVSPAD